MPKSDDTNPVTDPAVTCDFIGCPLPAAAETPAGKHFCPTHLTVYTTMEAQRGAASLLKPTAQPDPPARGEPRRTKTARKRRP